MIYLAIHLINHWIFLWNLSYLSLLSFLHVTLFNEIVYVKWINAWGHQFICTEWSLLGLKDTQFALHGEKGLKTTAPFIYFILHYRYTYNKVSKNIILYIHSIEIFMYLMVCSLGNFASYTLAHALMPWNSTMVSRIWSFLLLLFFTLYLDNIGYYYFVHFHKAHLNHLTVTMEQRHQNSTS